MRIKISPHPTIPKKITHLSHHLDLVLHKRQMISPHCLYTRADSLTQKSLNTGLVVSAMDPKCRRVSRYEKRMQRLETHGGQI